MPSADSTDSGDAQTTTDPEPTSSFDNVIEWWQSSPALVLATGLSVMAYATFSAVNRFLEAYEEGAVLVYSGLFFVGGYVAARGFFGGLAKTIADD